VKLILPAVTPEALIVPALTDEPTIVPADKVEVIRALPETSNEVLGAEVLIPTLPPVVYKFPKVFELYVEIKPLVTYSLPFING
jgi:hypothetical protein